MGQNENIIGEKIIGGLPPADNCLDKKINQAIKLIRAAGKDGQVVEVAYSGGKDSDVILELTRMAGINYRAIYKNTTIDPPGTIKHCIENHVEIITSTQNYRRAATAIIPFINAKILCPKTSKAVFGHKIFASIKS